MGQLKAISGGGQHDGVVTDDISPSHGMDTHFVAGTFSRHPDTSVTGILFIIKVIGLIQHLDKSSGCPAGSILLETVMDFDYLRIILGSKNFGCLLGQPEERVDPDAVVGRKDNRDLGGSLRDGLTNIIGMSRGSNHKNLS